MAKEKIQQKKIEIVNRRAKFEYFFTDEFEAGIVLTGTEIKSIRLGNANLTDSYCLFENGELWVRSMFVKEYEFGTDNNHQPRRNRKLLLRRVELRKLDKKVRERGNTIVPYKLYLNDKGLAKLTIVLATGKKSFDKRNTIKDRDEKRSRERESRE